MGGGTEVQRRRNRDGGTETEGTEVTEVTGQAFNTESRGHGGSGPIREVRRTSGRSAGRPSAGQGGHRGAGMQTRSEMSDAFVSRPHGDLQPRAARLRRTDTVRRTDVAETTIAQVVWPC